MALGIFDYIRVISSKSGAMPRDSLDEFNSVYVQHVVNLAFCRYIDTIMIVEKLCLMRKLTNLQHFDYLYNSIPKGIRNAKWNKKEEPQIDLEVISAVYNYSINKSKDVVNLFSTTDLELLKTKLIKGGSE